MSGVMSHATHTGISAGWITVDKLRGRLSLWPLIRSMAGLSILLMFPFLIFFFQNDILGDHPKELNQAGLPDGK